MCPTTVLLPINPYSIYDLAWTILKDHASIWININHESVFSVLSEGTSTIASICHLAAADWNLSCLYSVWDWDLVSTWCDHKSNLQAKRMCARSAQTYVHLWYIYIYNYIYIYTHAVHICTSLVITSLYDTQRPPSSIGSHLDSLLPFLSLWVSIVSLCFSIFWCLGFCL